MKTGSHSDSLPSDGLLKKLHELHAPNRVPSISEYQFACGEAALEIERLRAEVRNHARELRDAARDAAAEREWMHRQGEDYGTY